MKKGMCKGLFMFIMMLAMVLMKDGLIEVEAASAKLGVNGGIEWTYDEETKTITVTGEDTIVIDKEEPESPFINSGEKAQKVVFKNCKITGSMSGFFANMRNLRSIDFSGLNTSEVTDMSRMFRDCVLLTNLDFSRLDTSNVTNMSEMF